MQDSQQGQLEIPQNFTTGYNLIDSIEKNQITEKGCHSLSKAEWNLQIIDLCTYFNTQDGNKIGDRGCGHICRGSWPEIKLIFISIPQDIQLTAE